MIDGRRKTHVDTVEAQLRDLHARRRPRRYYDQGGRVWCTCDYTKGRHGELFHREGAPR